jgi:cytochrome P450
MPTGPVMESCGSRLHMALASETTATLMSGLTYYVLKDVECMAKLKAEIRNAFSTADEIDFVSVNKLPYLLACVDEALRVYPPVPDTFLRNTGPAAEIIYGKVVPAWVSMSSPKHRACLML